MPTSLIRGRSVICKIEGRDRAHIIDDGAVLERDGTIVEVGSFSDLAARHRVDAVLGSPDHVVLPGLVNAHHHLGLTPFRMGTPDLPLELWMIRNKGRRDVDPYLDTLQGAFELVESGVTTVQHLEYRAGGSPEAERERAEAILRAYRDVGLRVSFAADVVDQNRLVYGDDADVLRRLPAGLAAEAKAWIEARALSLDDQLALFDDLHAAHGGRRIRVQLAAANLHWCSDAALLAIAERAARHDVPIHMHLLETRHQKAYARRRAGTTAVAHLHDLGLLGPGLTLGHGVWVTEADIERIAETGTRICVNASSNLRLGSGIAPLNRYRERGVVVAIGIDEAGINDDRDMLQEMRMVLMLHREPGPDERPPTAAEVLRMATEQGALTTPYAGEVGTIEAGKAADLLVLRWPDIAFPSLDDRVPVIDAVVQRAKASAVDIVIVAGEAIYREGRFTRVDKMAALTALADAHKAPLTDRERRRRAMADALFPHVRRFYQELASEAPGEPFYRLNERR